MTTDKSKLETIEKLARRYCNSGVNPGAHLLASKILDVIDPDRIVERGVQFEAQDLDIEERAANLGPEGA